MRMCRTPGRLQGTKDFRKFLHTALRHVAHAQNHPAYRKSTLPAAAAVCSAVFSQRCVDLLPICHVPIPIPVPVRPATDNLHDSIVTDLFQQPQVVERGHESTQHQTTRPDPLSFWLGGESVTESFACGKHHLASVPVQRC